MFTTIRDWASKTSSFVSLTLSHEAVRAISREGSLVIAIIVVILSAVAVIICPRS